MNNITITNNDCKYIYLFKKNLIKALKKKGYKITIVAPRDDYSDRLSELGVSYYPIKLNTHGINPISDIITLAHLYIAYKRIKPHANLLFTIKPNLYGTIASSILSIKTINNVTGLGAAFVRAGLTQLVVKLMYKIAFNFSTKILFQNRDDKNLFVHQKLVDQNKTIVIPGSGVDIDRFKPRRKLPGDKIIFLMIGRMLIDKGILEYIEAARQSKSNNIEAEFWLLGECDSAGKRSIGKADLTKWEREGIIRYLGEVEDVRDIIAKSDVVILPSYREGMPRVLLEGLAMGKPVIGTDVPGCRSIIEDGKNGYLCKAKDAADLFLQIKKMVSLGNNERSLMGQNGRNKVVSNYDERIVILKYLELLKQFSVVAD